MMRSLFKEEEQQLMQFIEKSQVLARDGDILVGGAFSDLFEEWYPFLLN